MLLCPRWFLVKAHPSPGMSIKCIAEVKKSVSHEESCLCSKREPSLKVCTIQNVGGWVGGERACAHFEKSRDHCASQIDSIGRQKLGRNGWNVLLRSFHSSNSATLPFFALHDLKICNGSGILFLSHQRNAHNSKPFKATSHLPTILFSD